VDRAQSAGGGLFPVPNQDPGFTTFNNALWFDGFTGTQGFQLYKLGFDGSVTQWTTINPSLFVPNQDPGFTTFNNALWFDGFTGAQGFQLYKLGFDGSVTQWTAINPSLFVPNQTPGFTTFNNALWFDGFTGAQGFQLYKLGFDGSVTKWTALNTGGGGLNPQNMFEFANALWFSGNTGVGGQQLFKLGADGSVTQWTNVPGGFNPRLVSANTLPLAVPGREDRDSTPSSIFQNAAWLQGTNAANDGTELYKLGADGSVTFWKDINPGPAGSLLFDWARFA